MSWRAALACALAALGVAAAGMAAEVDAPHRPRIGLVLGGGGAKGAAHIGVLRALEELRVPVDCVAGTSMGALIGATFASGMAPSDIERKVTSINWSSTVGSEGLRDRMPIRRKLAGITYTNNLEFGLKKGELLTPVGLLRSQDVENVLRALVSEARLTRNFDDLPLPFRAVATDLRTGQMVVLGSGDLAVVMRASMAVPGAFSPVRMQDRVLVDGGLMRNLPVDIARDLCGEVVIAVTPVVPQPSADELDSAVVLASRSLDVMIDANTNAQLATLTDRDVSIVVPMGDIGSTDFDRVPEAIPLGRAAAMAQAEALRRYAVSEAEYRAWRDGITRAGAAPVVIAAVNINGLDRVNASYVRSQLRNVAPGRAVTDAQVAEDTGRIYSLGDFERVEYRFVTTPTGTNLDIRVVEKPIGPNFLNFDLGLAADGDGEVQAVVRGEHRRSWVNRFGGEWHNIVQIGEQTIAETYLYQPLDHPQRVFLQPTLHYERTLEEYFDDGDPLARYELRETWAQLDIGANFGTRVQLRAGIRSGWLDAELDTGDPVVRELNTENESSVILQFVWDTRDSVGLPTRGSFMNARYTNSGSFLDGEQRYEMVEGVLTQSFPWRGDSLSFILGAGAELDGDLPPTQEFRLGGIRTFPGLQRGELRGDSYWFAGTSYLWKLADLQTLFGQALYAGLRLQAGRIGERLDDTDDGTLYGIAGSLGGRTPIGPFLLSLGYVDNSSWQLQFGLGRPIAEGSILDEIR